LEHHPHSPGELAVVVRPRWVEAEDPEHSARLGPVPLESFNRAGLTRSITAEEGDYLTGLCREVEAVDRHQVSVPDDESGDLDGGYVGTGHAA
jgi:hypothetical protein